MPSLKGKAWAGANGDWIVYIGYNYEWELVNVYTHHRVHFQKSQTAQRLSTPVFYARSNTIMMTVLRKIEICRVPNRSWDYMNYEVVAIFDKLVAVLTSTP